MAADEHPFDALGQRFRTEEIFVSPVGRAVANMASCLPLPWPLDKAVAKIRDHLGADSQERIRIMLETCIDEVRRHGDEIRGFQQRLAAEDCDARAEALKDLILDGARKSEATRAKERIRRIGLILASVTIDPKPIETDEVEEMMRIAMELNDKDVILLKQVVRADETGPNRPVSDRHRGKRSNEVWLEMPWRQIGFDTDEVESIASKLQSFGLLAAGNNLARGNTYMVLRKARDFIAYIRSND